MKAILLQALRTRASLPEMKASRIVLVCYVLLAVVAPLIAPQNPYDPLQIFGWEASAPPLAVSSGGFIYLLGTDGLGRDIMSLILFGLRISLVVALVSSAIAAAIGLAAGVSAAFFGKWIDSVIMRLVDLQLSLPTILVALIAIVALGPGVDRIILALVIAQWATYARLARGVALSENTKSYMDAARLLRMPTLRIIFRHLLPNSIAASGDTLSDRSGARDRTRGNSLLSRARRSARSTFAWICRCEWISVPSDRAILDQPLSGPSTVWLGRVHQLCRGRSSTLP
jgi:peptide/nickel transport system permease protein